MSRTIREAKPADMPEIMQVMEAAKKIMRSSGNMHQWGDGYPSEAVITNDMEKHGGFVIEDAGRIVGYFAFLSSPEPTYSKIYNGEWLNPITSSIALPVILMFTASSATSWISASRMIRTSASIPTRKTLSCSTTSRSTASPIVALSTSPQVTSAWLIRK